MTLAATSHRQVQLDKRQARRVRKGRCYEAKRMACAGPADDGGLLARAEGRGGGSLGFKFRASSVLEGLKTVVESE